jgi:uncharacterized protein (TIGR02285 family)
MKFLIVLFALGLIGISQAGASEKTSPKNPDKKTIYWMFWELPGAVNMANDHEPVGYIMEIFYLLKTKMPEYTHQVIEVPFIRSLEQMKKKPGTCSLMLLKNPEREKFMTFGKPYIPGMPAGVLAAKDNKKIIPYVTNSKVIDIDKLLKDRSIEFGVVAGRFYGQKISEGLKAHPSAKVLLKQGSQVDRELRNLLKLGRIDVYFGYPFEIEGNERAQFYFVKGNTDLLEPRIGCDNSPLGEEIVAKTEESRAKYKLDKEFIAIYERFYSKSMQEEFRKMSKGAP